jgi:hypothetical protein
MPSGYPKNRDLSDCTPRQAWPLFWTETRCPAILASRLWRNSPRKAPMGSTKLIPVQNHREINERLRLLRLAGLSTASHFQRPVERPFTGEERSRVTILFDELTWKHEKLIPRLSLEEVVIAAKPRRIPTWWPITWGSNMATPDNATPPPSR